MNEQAKQLYEERESSGCIENRCKNDYIELVEIVNFTHEYTNKI